MDASHKLRRDLACARRAVGGLTDPHSRRVLRDYIAELETRLAQSPSQSAAA